MIDEVKKAVADALKMPVDKLTPDTRLEEIAGDSLDFIETVFAIEEKFDIEFAVDPNARPFMVTIKNKDGTTEQKTIATIRDISDAVQKIVGAKAS